MFNFIYILQKIIKKKNNELKFLLIFLNKFNNIIFSKIQTYLGTMVLIDSETIWLEIENKAASGVALYVVAVVNKNCFILYIYLIYKFFKKVNIKALILFSI